MNPAIYMNGMSGMNLSQPWRKHNALQEMGGPLRALKPTLRCLINDFRDYAWANFGLPANLEDLEEIAQSFRISRYTFRKNWNRLEKFFREIDGKLFYEADENQREEFNFRIEKSRESGKLGAQKKRERSSDQNPIPFPDNEFSTRVPIGNLKPPSSILEVEVEEEGSSEPFSKTEGVPAAAPASPTPPNRPEAAEAAGPPHDFERNPETRPTSESQDSNLPARPFTDRDHEDIANRCAELGLHSPDRKTAALIVSRFPTIPISRYPKFPMQNSPGLWLHKTSLDMQLEMARQSKPEPRELTKREKQNQELLRWAREEDRKRAMQQ